MKWIGAHDEVSVFGVSLTGGLCYVTDRANGMGEASLIDLSLPVGDADLGDLEPLSYFPQYRFLSPNQRASYIRWIAMGRRDDDPSARDLGQVFLFIYGVERRLLVEKEPDEEAVAELVRLLDRYGPFTRSSSLQAYTCQLIHFWGWQQGAEYYSQLWEWIQDLPVALLGSDELGLVLANHHQLGRRLPASLAYEVALKSPDTKSSVVVKRVNAEFRELFAQRYAEEFGDGLELRCSKRDSRLRYRPASPTLYHGNLSVTAPNVMGIQSQFRPIVAIWNSCIEDLKQYSRNKLKNTAEGDLKAHLALPEELRSQSEHPLMERWWGVMQSYAYQDGCLVMPAGDIAELIQIEACEKIALGRSKKIAETVESLGFCIEPDARYDGCAYGWDQEVGIFQMSDGSAAVPSRAYSGRSSLLQLGILIAAADGDLHQEEVDLVRQFIEGQVETEDSDHRRLMVLERLLIDDPMKAKASLARIARRVPKDQREKIGEVLVYIAAADNLITKEETRALKRIYKAFSLPPDNLDRLLESLQPSQEVTIQQAGVPVPGEAIPQPATSGPQFSLDLNRVAEISAETSEVISILSAVMSDEESGELIGTVGDSEALIEPAAEPEPAGAEVSADWATELDSRYRPILAKLLASSTWSRSEFDAIAENHQLMPLGAYDAINEWADEILGDFILEGDDPVIINLSMIPEGGSQ